MEIINDNGKNQFFRDENYESRARVSKIFIGICVVAAGALFLMRKTGTEIPSWLLSWPMIFVVGGIASLIKHGFKRIHSYLFLGFGLLFLADKFLQEIELKPYIWPLVIMAIGLAIIFKPRRRHHHWRNYQCEKKKWNVKDKEDFLEVNSIFGGVERTVINKNFKGGEINSVFGGSEVNLGQADIEGTADLEIHSVFGSTKLIVPSHWEIKSELNAVFGGIEDKRAAHPQTGFSENKLLILRGDCVFGGIEIRNY